MTTHEFNNRSDLAERLEVLKDTYLNRAAADTDLSAQGRFKKETATRVTGVPEYPKQPANSFWSCDPVPATEPLGFSVNAMEPLEPAPEPPEVNASPPAVEDGVGERVGTPPLVPTCSLVKRSW